MVRQQLGAGTRTDYGYTESFLTVSIQVPGITSSISGEQLVWREVNFPTARSR
jgi:hypothetical protein